MRMILIFSRADEEEGSEPVGGIGGNKTRKRRDREKEKTLRKANRRLRLRKLAE